MKRTVSLRRNADGTYSVKCGREVEHVAADGKSHYELFDHLKWAIVAKGVYMHDADLAELIDKARRT